MKQYTIRSTIVVRGEIINPILVTQKINDVLSEVESLLSRHNVQSINIEVRELAEAPKFGVFGLGIPEAVPVR